MTTNAADLAQAIPSKNNADEVEISERINIQTEVVTPSQLIGGNMIPVGSKGLGYEIRKDTQNQYKGNTTFHFLRKDDQKTRVEFSSAFITSFDIQELSKKQIDQHIAAKSLYHFSKGIVGKGQPWVYEYGLWLPKSINQKTQAIISQWHGVADRTTIQTPEGEIKTFSLETFNDKILTRMFFKKNLGFDKTTKKPNGTRVDQGGYPPVSLKLGDGFLYLLARADFSRVTDKSDRVNLRPSQVGKIKYSPLRTKVVTIPFAKKLDSLPREQWIDMKWVITWSEWNPSGKRTNGSILLFMDGKKVIDWNGPLGNNDDHGTYFKYGLYKTGATGAEIKLSGFRQRRLKTDSK